MENYTKYCPDCGHDKPASEFHKCMRNDDNLQRYCKHHQNLRNENYRKRTLGAYWKSKPGQLHSVYSFTAPDNKVYVGYTSGNTKLRYQRHLAQYKHKKASIPLLYESFDKYGFEAHTFSVLSEHVTKEEARQKETIFIAEHMRKGTSLNEALSSLRVGQYDRHTGELIKVWNSVGEAAKSFNYKSSWIYSAVRGDRGYKTAHGYHWKEVPFADGTLINYAQLKGNN